MTGFVFANDRLPPVNMVSKFSVLAKQMDEARLRLRDKEWNVKQLQQVELHPPPVNCLKLNVNASIASDSNHAFGGGVL